MIWNGIADKNLPPWSDQKARDIEKYGIKKAPWIVDWIEPNGKRRSKSFGAGRENSGYFGFHDLRRGYATANAEHMDLFELQKLMQHRSLETTQGYVSMAGKLKKAINKAHVPDFLTVREPFTSLQEKKATGE